MEISYNYNLVEIDTLIELFNDELTVLRVPDGIEEISEKCSRNLYIQKKFKESTSSGFNEFYNVF